MFAFFLSRQNSSPEYSAFSHFGNRAEISPYGLKAKLVPVTGPALSAGSCEKALNDYSAWKESADWNVFSMWLRDPD